VFFLIIIINVKALFNFEKEWGTFDKEKRRLKKRKSCHGCFEHAKRLLKHYQFAQRYNLQFK
jgi:hypothetical protein